MDGILGAVKFLAKSYIIWMGLLFFMLFLCSHQFFG